MTKLDDAVPLEDWILFSPEDVRRARLAAARWAFEEAAKEADFLLAPGLLKPSARRKRN